MLATIPDYSSHEIRKETLRNILTKDGELIEGVIGFSNTTVLIESIKNRKQVEELIRGCSEGDRLLPYIHIEV